MLTQAKKDGFSDKYLAQICKVSEEEIRTAREAAGVVEGWEGVHVSGTKDSAYYYLKGNHDETGYFESGKSCYESKRRLNHL